MAKTFFYLILSPLHFSLHVLNLYQSNIGFISYFTYMGPKLRFVHQAYTWQVGFHVSVPLPRGIIFPLTFSPLTPLHFKLSLKFWEIFSISLQHRASSYSHYYYSSSGIQEKIFKEKPKNPQHACWRQEQQADCITDLIIHLDTSRSHKSTHTHKKNENKSNNKSNKK